MRKLLADLSHLHTFFFSLLLLFLPSQLGRHFWPDWSLVLGRRIDYLSPTLYFTDILLILTVCTFAISSYLQFRKNKKSHQSVISSVIINSQLSIRNYKKMLFIFSGIFLLSIINILHATRPFISLYMWAKFCEYVFLIIYIRRTKPGLNVIVPFLSIGILYSSVLAILEFIVQHSLGGVWWFLGERTFTINTLGIARSSLSWHLGPLGISIPEYLRPYATFPHPNVLGGFLATTTPLLFLYLSKRKLAFPEKSFYVLVMVLLFCALLFTTSRSAWIATAVGIILFVQGRKLHKLSAMASTFLSLIIILISIVLVALSPGESVEVRQQLANSAVSLIRLSPLLGVGAGNFLVSLPQVLPVHTIYFLQPVHNIYLLVLSELGVVGVMTILLALFIYLRIFRQSLSPSPLLIPLGLLLLIGIVDHYPLTLQQGQLMLAIYIGLATLGY